MAIEEEPIWIRAGLSQKDYQSLPWEKRKQLLLRHGWSFWLKEICHKCGVPISTTSQPAEGHLLNAWLRGDEGKEFLLSVKGREWLSHFERQKLIAENKLCAVATKPLGRG